MNFIRSRRARLRLCSSFAAASNDIFKLCVTELHCLAFLKAAAWISQHAYPTWCQSSGAKALPEKRAGQAMLKAFARHDAKVRETDGALVVFNVALRSDRKAIEDLRAAA